MKQTSLTSKWAYDEIRRTRALTMARWKVYDLLYRKGPLTGNDVDRLLGSPSAHKRLSELEERGVARQHGYRLDAHTGMTNVMWEVVPGAMPVNPLPKSKP